MALEGPSSRSTPPTAKTAIVQALWKTAADYVLAQARPAHPPPGGEGDLGPALIATSRLPSVGMALLDAHSLYMEIANDGRVVVQPIGL